MLPGIIGTMQAAETLKLVIGGGQPLLGRLAMLDAWGAHLREIPVVKNPACPVCGDEVRSVFFADNSLEYCPTCQTGGKILADRRMSRLLK